MGERIECVALRHLDTGLTLSMPRPARHAHIINGIQAPDVVATMEQGFLTAAGRFVDRLEACRIAEAAGQLIQKTSPKDMLFSEDLW